VGADPFFVSRRVQMVQMAARHMVPATYALREFAEIGGLMSYQYCGCKASTRCLCRPHPQRRKARRPAGSAVVEVGAGHQPPDRQNARPHSAR
jgi:hypothetical protein